LSTKSDDRDQHVLAAQLADLRGAARDQLPCLARRTAANDGGEHRVVAASGRQVRRVDEGDRHVAATHRAGEITGAGVVAPGAGAAERSAEVIAEPGRELDARRRRRDRRTRREQPDAHGVGMRGRTERDEASDEASDEHQRDDDAAHDAPP
jgi:hypothetical protein